MINSVDTVTNVSTQAPVSLRIDRVDVWGRISLTLIMLLSIFMDFFRLGENGYGNLYYAAGVRSMADSWHNFFFVSFDPGGFVAIDKPPLGFWLQVLSTKIFGFTAFSIFLPQALCGVLTVLLLYILVRRHYGQVAGLVAALALAITPISVVTNRNNTIDGTLAFILLLAAWAVIQAAESGKLRWLILSAVFVGLGFNVKMAEAYLVIPALGLTYLLCAPRKLWTRIWHLALALLVILILSILWVAIVDMVPASLRPYVGSTQDNSEISLAFGYNGLNRFNVGANLTPSPNKSTVTKKNSVGTISGHLKSTGHPKIIDSNLANKPATGWGRFFQTINVGPFHLFSVALGGQIAWLLPFALLAIVALAWQRRFDFQKDRQQLGLVLWGIWLLTMAFFFSESPSFHVYYMTVMSPGLSALVGIGLVTMWHDYRAAGWQGWLLPLALAVTAITQIYMLTAYPHYTHRIILFICIVTSVAVIVLLLLRIKQMLKMHKHFFNLGRILVGIELLVLCLAPAVWSGYSVIHNFEASVPTAGPNTTQANTLTFTNIKTALHTTKQQGTKIVGNQFADLISYLQTNQGKTKFIVAIQGTNISDSIILAINKPVMALGGFSGKDQILTTSSMQTLIKQNIIRFFLVTHGQPTPLTDWVSNHCRAIPPITWNNTKTSNMGMYDCAYQHIYQPTHKPTHTIPHKKGKTHTRPTI